MFSTRFSNVQFSLYVVRKLSGLTGLAVVIEINSPPEFISRIRSRSLRYSTVMNRYDNLVNKELGTRSSPASETEGQ